MSIKGKYIQFRRLLEAGDDAATLAFLETLSAKEIMAINFKAIIATDENLQEVKDFVIRQYGGMGEWHRRLI